METTGILGPRRHYLGVGWKEAQTINVGMLTWAPTLWSRLWQGHVY